MSLLALRDVPTPRAPHCVHRRHRYSDLRPHGQLPARIRKAFEEMRALQVGWDTYRAPPPTDASIAAAEATLSALAAETSLGDADAIAMNLGPSHDGGVTMEWSHGAKTILVTFNQAGKILLSRSDDDDDVGDRKVNVQSFVDAVCWLRA